MFRFFERLLEPTEKPPDTPPPALGSPHALVRFYWHFVRQVPGLLAALFVTGFIVALLDAAIPVFIGRIVTLVTSQTPETIWATARLAASRHGGAAAGAAAGRAFRAGAGHQPGADPRPHQPDALAEPLACRAPELDVLSRTISPGASPTG